MTTLLSFAEGEKTGKPGEKPWLVLHDMEQHIKQSQFTYDPRA